MRKIPTYTIVEPSNIALPNSRDWLKQISQLIPREQKQLLRTVQAVSLSLKNIHNSSTEKERINHLKTLINLCQECITFNLNKINQAYYPLSDGARTKAFISPETDDNIKKYTELFCYFMKLSATAECMASAIIGDPDKEYLKLLLRSKKPPKDYRISPDYYDPSFHSSRESNNTEEDSTFLDAGKLPTKENTTTFNLPTPEECEAALLTALDELYIQEKHKIKLQSLIKQAAQCLHKFHEKNKTKELDNLLDICNKIIEEEGVYGTSLSQKVKDLLQIPAETIIIKRGLLPLNEQERKKDRKRTLYLKPSTTASPYRIFQSNGQFFKFRKRKDGELCMEPYCRIGDTLNEESQESTIVVDDKGRWFAGCTRASSLPNNNFHHSSFVFGRSVKFAGVIKFSAYQSNKVSWLRKLIYFLKLKMKPEKGAAGIPLTVSNQSGHYLTPPDAVRHFMKENLPKVSLSRIKIIKIVKPYSKRNCFDELTLKEFIVDDDTPPIQFSPAILPAFFYFWINISNTGLTSHRNQLLRSIDQLNKKILDKQTTAYQDPEEYRMLIEQIIIMIGHFINRHPNSKRLYSLKYAKWLWLSYYKKCFSSCSESREFIESEEGTINLKDLLLPSSSWMSISSRGFTNRRNKDLKVIDQLHKKLLNKVSHDMPNTDQLEQIIVELSKKINSYIERHPKHLQLVASLKLLETYWTLYLKQNFVASSRKPLKSPTLWNQRKTIDNYTAPPLKQLGTRQRQTRHYSLRH